MVDLFRFLHVLAISLWIGAALWVAGDIRRTMALGRPHVDGLASRVWLALGLDAVAGVATLITGILLLVAEGVARPRFGIAAGFFLALVRLGILGAIRTSWKGLAAHVEHGVEIPPYEARVRRIAILSGIAHATWVLALAGMVLRV